MVDARVWLATAVVVPVMVVGATALIVAVPLIDEASDVRTQTHGQAAQNEAQRAENAVLEARAANIEELRAEADAVRHRLPTVLDQERLSREIHDRAAAAGMTLSSFAQGAAQVVDGQPGYVRVPVQLEFFGPVGADRWRLLASLQAGPGSEHGDGHDLFVTLVRLVDEEDEDDPDRARTLAVHGFLVLSAALPVVESEDEATDEVVS